MNKIILYIHGKGGGPDEAEHYKALFPQSDVASLDYHAQTTWQAKEEFPSLFRKACKGYNSVVLIANSIGAFFAMNALQSEKIERAFFISPVVRSERQFDFLRHGFRVRKKTRRFAYRYGKRRALVSHGGANAFS